MIDFNKKNNVVYKLSPSVLSRFESNINEGTVFLYNADYSFLWTGNFDSYLIIKLIDGKRRFKEIVRMLAKHCQADEKDIIPYTQNLIDVLKEKKFIEKVECV